MKLCVLPPVEQPQLRAEFERSQLRVSPVPQGTAPWPGTLGGEPALSWGLLCGSTPTQPLVLS